ncbi:MAG: hypothetical protein LBQ50_11465, partial [Planctomycetaceae bacterium]|nr:hypothetical protein [Planctomycetaceae bacterium]
MLDSTPGLLQQNSTQKSTKSAGNGLSSPLYNPLFGNPKKTEMENLNPGYSPLPSLFGSPPSSLGNTNITPGDFSVGDPSYNIPSYGTPFYNPPSRFRRGMTREEYVLQQAEEARMKEFNREEQENRLRKQYEVEKEIRKGIYSLFNESGHQLPKVLSETSETSDSVGNSSIPVTETLPPSKTPSLPDLPGLPDTSKSLADASESLTPEERTEQELKAKKTELEALEDSEQKQRELKALQQRENERKRWLQQRAEAERGTTLFELPPALRLKDQMLKEG